MRGKQLSEIRDGANSAPEQEVNSARALADRIRNRSGFSDDDAKSWRHVVEWLLTNAETRHSVEEAFRLMDEPTAKTALQQLRATIPPEPLEASDRALQKLITAFGIPTFPGRSDYLLGFVFAHEEVRKLFESARARPRKKAGRKLKYDDADLFQLGQDYRAFLESCSPTRHGLIRTSEDKQNEFLKSARTKYAWLPKGNKTARNVLDLGLKVRIHTVGGREIASTDEGLHVHRFNHYRRAAGYYWQSLRPIHRELDCDEGELQPRRIKDQKIAKLKEAEARDLAARTIRDGSKGRLKLMD